MHAGMKRNFQVMPGAEWLALRARQRSPPSMGVEAWPAHASCRSPTAQFPTSPERRARLTWRARGLHDLPQRPLPSAPAARIGRWSTRGQPRSRSIGRTEHQSGITAALHWHRTPATDALVFLFLTNEEQA